MNRRALLVAGMVALMAGCESQSHLQVDVPRAASTLNLTQTVTSVGAVVVLPLPTDAQAAMGFTKAPADFYTANKVTILSGTRGVDFVRSSMNVPVGNATLSVPILSTVVTSVFSPDPSGNADVMISLNGNPPQVYTAKITNP